MLENIAERYYQHTVDLPVDLCIVIGERRADVVAVVVFVVIFAILGTYVPTRRVHLFGLVGLT